MSKQILVHGRMLYRCTNCGEIIPMYLEEGVEGKDKKVPCPFIINCPECGGEMMHSFWSMDSYFEPRALLPEESYFKYKEPHAIPVIRR